MTSNSLTEIVEHDIPSQIFGLHTSVIFRPQYVCFLTHFGVMWSETLVVN